MTAPVLTTLDSVPSLKRTLAHRLKSMDPILRFEEEPLLASLCASLALHSEIGDPDFDRLSPFLGAGEEVEWEKEVVLRGSEAGIRLRRKDGQPLSPHHPDLAYVLDRHSLDEKGNLSQALIFPNQIAAHYRSKGFDMVIVRDWILSSAFAENEVERVAYLLTNDWEIENHIAGTQAPMMLRRQLALFGTHDIVDHLFGASAEGFLALRSTHEKVVEAFERFLSGALRYSTPHLTLAYLVGVVLDDLAQPRWYGSEVHAYVIEFSLKALESAEAAFGVLKIPQSFHAIAEAMRSGEGDFALLQARLEAFATEIKKAPNQQN